MINVVVRTKKDEWDGNIAFKKPIKIFDLENGLAGPHPIGYNGVQFDMGEDSKLRYMFVDSLGVINGQKYYYAITSYDKGYDLDFYDKYYPPGSYTDQHVNTLKYFNPDKENPYKQKPEKKHPWDK